MLNKKRLHHFSTKNLLSLTSLLSIVIFTIPIKTSYSQAFPLNDACTGATEIANTPLCQEGRLTIVGSTIWGLPEEKIVNSASCSRTEITSPGVWYRLSDYSGSLNILANGESGFDTQLSVYTGSCEDLGCMTYNDDAKCDLSSSMVDIQADASIDYYILVHGYGNTVGDFNLNLTTSPCNSNTITQRLPEQVEEASQSNTNIMTIYPNPAEEHITVTLPISQQNNMELLEIRLLNSLGQTLRSQSSNSPTTELNTTNLSGGFYHIQVLNPVTGEKTVSPFYKK